MMHGPINIRIYSSFKIQLKAAAYGMVFKAFSLGV